jgi:biotin carboxyl carrier protein
MKCEIRIAGKTRQIELESSGGGWAVLLDGQPVQADIIEVSPGVYSILLGGRSYEAFVTPSPDGEGLTIQSGAEEFFAEVLDPRAWRGRRHGFPEVEGVQQVSVPMPGKVVRVLVQQGDRVEAGQSLCVVEAMKMQNEIRSPKSGVVERLLVTEGQAVKAGEPLAWVN